MTGSRPALLALALLLLGPLRSPGADDAYRNSIVDLIVTYQEDDPIQPWQSRQPGTRQGHGAVIREGMILTTEDLVRGHRLIEVRKSESGVKLTATVVEADEQVNLALLRIENDEHLKSFGDLDPLPVAAALSDTPALQVLQFDETDRLQSGPAELIKYSLSQLPSAPHRVLAYQALTDIKVTRRSAPVLEAGKLAGFIAAYDASARTAYILPPELLNAFLDDVATPPYVGFASAGFTWSPLSDPVKRRWLSVPDTEEGGVLVHGVIPGTGAEDKLLPNDVILAWDGFPLTNQGFYEDPDFGRLLFSHLIKGRKRPGDMAVLEIVRDGKVQEIQIQLTRPRESTALIPENTLGLPVPYLVEAGFVIRELTGDYLRAHGGNWWARIDAGLVNMYNTQAAAPSEPGNRIVIVSHVLPHQVNVGYQHIRNEVIEKVNGKPVANIGDVFDILMADGALERLKLARMNIEIVIDPDAAREANGHLASMYRIPQLRSRPTP